MKPWSWYHKVETQKIFQPNLPLKSDLRDHHLSLWSTLIQGNLTIFKLYRIVLSFQKVQDNEIIIFELGVSKRWSWLSKSEFWVIFMASSSCNLEPKLHNLTLQAILLINLTLIRRLHKPLVHYTRDWSINQVLMPYLEGFAKSFISILIKANFFNHSYIELITCFLWLHLTYKPKSNILNLKKSTSKLLISLHIFIMIHYAFLCKMKPSHQTSIPI